MTAEWSEHGLRELRFVSKAKRASWPARRGGVPLREARRLARELDRYFRTGRARFTVGLDLSAGSEFDRAVWEELRRIPAGELRTYAEVARSIGRPRSARAVGGACGRNPVAIVVPCHRVVGSGGLGGFAAGRALKRRLIELEGARVPGDGRSRAGGDR